MPNISLYTRKGLEGVRWSKAVSRAFISRRRVALQVLAPFLKEFNESAGVYLGERLSPSV